MNDFRVDRNNEEIVPCGVNSILYIGDNREKAQAVFKRANAGLNWWNNTDNYGVILSRWNSNTQDYQVIESKGIQS